jgi:hypothetical protein
VEKEEGDGRNFLGLNGGRGEKCDQTKSGIYFANQEDRNRKDEEMGKGGGEEKERQEV